MFIAFGAAFEVPVVVVVLARMGIVSIEKLKAFRGYFVVLAFIVAAVVTPPDVISQLALAIPMCLLYEVGIWAARIFIKHTQAPRGRSRSDAASLSALRWRYCGSRRCGRGRCTTVTLSSQRLVAALHADHRLRLRASAPPPRRAAAPCWSTGLSADLHDHVAGPHAAFAGRARPAARR